MGTGPSAPGHRTPTQGQHRMLASWKGPTLRCEWGGHDSKSAMGGYLCHFSPVAISATSALPGGAAVGPLQPQWGVEMLGEGGAQRLLRPWPPADR